MLGINGKAIGSTDRPYIIAEMACAHNGKKDYVFKLIDLAAKGGADAIQFQIFDVPEMIVSSHEVFDAIKDIEFSRADWKEFTEYARKYEIDVLACAYDLKSLEFSIELGMDGIKFNSSDLLNIYMLELAAKSKIPFLLHTGASSMQEISQAINYANQFNPSQIILMHGVQNFPTSIDNLNIGRMNLLKENFKLPSGYDDHTDADTDFAKVVDLVAVGMGADVVEKHITLSRAEKGLDYQSALEENEFKNYVERIHLGAKAKGNMKIKPFDDSDYRYRKFQKKSIVAIKDLKAGDILKKEDFKFLRNSQVGLQGIESIKMIGKKLNKDIKTFSNIYHEDLS